MRQKYFVIGIEVVTHFSDPFQNHGVQAPHATAIVCQDSECHRDIFLDHYLGDELLRKAQPHNPGPEVSATNEPLPSSHDAPG